MDNRIIKYFSPLIVFGVILGAFLLYGSSYSPIKPNIQVVLCYKFKFDVKEEVKIAQQKEFFKLAKQLPLVADYSFGKIKNEEKSNFEVIHRLTFRSENDLDKFHQTPEYLNLVESNQKYWDSQLEIKADLK
jgi:hypothetical protein